MFFNATVTTANIATPASVPDRVIPSGVSCVPALPTTVHPPLMRSKAAPYRGFPDQPDRHAMRERRHIEELTVVQLQRRRGIDKEPNPHEQILEAYGYQQLAEWAGTLFTQGCRVLKGLADRADFALGPPGSEAASVGGSAQSLDAFLGKFSRDFEFWVSPTARRATDMKGVIIVLGEDHYDRTIQKMIRQVMLSFRRTRGDRFFLEGDDPQGCAERVAKYLMEPDDCQFLEKGSSAFATLKKQQDDARLAVSSCAEFIRKHVPAARHESSDGNIVALTAFVRRHTSQLPVSVIPEFQMRLNRANDLLDRLETMLPQFRSERDQQMATHLRQQQAKDGRIFAIVGCSHLQALREYLQDLPCIFMMPRLVVERNSAPSLRSNPKQEL